MPSVEDKHHAAIESSVIDSFAQRGWQTIDLTYHANTTEDQKTTISHNPSFTSWLVRCRSDRISFNQQAMVKWDAKSCSWPKDSDFAIESMPLFAMIMDERLGANCRFFCQRHDGSQYVIQPNQVIAHASRILVPTKRRNEEILCNVIEWHRSIAELIGMNTHVMKTDTRQGSGDPFVCVAIDDFESPSFSEWFELL